MLNVRIVKGGCRGREAVRFGVVSLKFCPQKSHLVQILHLWSRNLPFHGKLCAKPVVSGGKMASKTIPATSVVCLFSLPKSLPNFWQFFAELTITIYKGLIAHILQFSLKNVEHLRKDFERVKCSV